MMKKAWLFILILMVVAQDVAAQCAMCKAVAEDQAEEGASGINTGILYIMAIPYIILFIMFRKRIFGLFKALNDAKRDPIKE